MSLLTMVSTYYITNVGAFHQRFIELKEDAKCGSIPERYLVGFDTEYIPKNGFIPLNNPCRWLPGGKISSNVVVCVLSIASKNICLVIHLPTFGCSWPNKLVHLVTKASWIKVGVGVALDLKYCSENFGLGQCSGGIDLQNLALIGQCKDQHLLGLYHRFVLRNGKQELKKKSKGICDWSKTRLFEKEICYAANDAIMSLSIFNALLAPSMLLMRMTQPPEKMPLQAQIHNEIVENTSISSSPQQMFPLLAAQQPLQQQQQPTISNPIGWLNEYAQQHRLPMPSYTNRKSNSAYRFCILCTFNGMSLVGFGNNKKEAKTQAALTLCCKLNMF